MGETGQILVTEKQTIGTCMYANCYIYFYVAKNNYVRKLETVLYLLCLPHVVQANPIY